VVIHSLFTEQPRRGTFSETHSCCDAPRFIACHDLCVKQEVFQESVRKMSEENTGAEFSIALPSQQVRQRAHRYMLDWGFSIGPNLTGESVEYQVVRRKKFPLNLLPISADFYRVRLSMREEGKGRTRLTLKTAQKGRWPEVRHEIIRWITEDLKGAPLSEWQQEEE
jgi:hypothetical protein